MKNIYKIIKSVIKQNTLECFIISRKPAILISYWHDFYYKHHRQILQALPPDKKSYIIFQIGYYKSLEAIQEVKEQLGKIQMLNKNIEYIFLANSEEEFTNFNNAGFHVIFCNQNCFLDENHYHVLPKISKKYDAIYIARMTPVKRHQLARKIDKLLLLGSYYKKEMEHVNQVKAVLKHAKWIEKVPHSVISRYINQAKVGLALSDVEGAMFVSTEYLLCGLPQVSTPSVGGRDVYFHNDYVAMVEPNEDAVLAGVQKMAECKTTPYQIRENTIQMMEQHRKYFIDLIQSIYDKEGVQKTFREEWKKIFTHKLALRIFVPIKVYRTRMLKPKMKLF
jgi:hypothetical protein